MNKEQMIVENMAIVKVIARQYFVPSGWEEDVMQEGYYGLCVAAEKYDPARGVTFRSYAAWWVRFYIEEGIRAATTIRIPQHQDRNQITYEKLDQSAPGDDNDALTLSEIYPSDDTADGKFTQEENEAEFSARLARLNVHEMRILSLRYGLEGTDEMSTKQISLVIGVTPRMIEIILQNSYNKMR